MVMTQYRNGCDVYMYTSYPARSKITVRYVNEYLRRVAYLPHVNDTSGNYAHRYSVIAMK